MKKKFVLIGAGHSHLTFLKNTDADFFNSFSITLIETNLKIVYSGMTPGYILGNYELDNINIDINKICNHYNIDFLNCNIEDIDFENKKIFYQDKFINYDYLSINTGSTIDLKIIPGAQSFGIPVKPLSNFLKKIEIIKNSKNKEVSFIGAGFAGLELLFALSSVNTSHTYNLFTNKKNILPDLPNKISSIIEKEIQYRKINVYPNMNITKQSNNAIFDDKSSYTSDYTIYSTGPSVSQFIKKLKLKKDSKGFISVNEYFETSSKDCFALGDCISMFNLSQKSGVFAVRHGEYLAKNLKDILSGKGVTPFTPQKKFMLILQLSRYAALLYRGNLIYKGFIPHLLKRLIDTSYIRSLNFDSK